MVADDRIAAPDARDGSGQKVPALYRIADLEAKAALLDPDYGAESFAAAGSLVVLLVWVYYSAQIFLLGAEFTWVYAHAHGSRRGEKRPGAPLDEMEAPKEVPAAVRLAPEGIWASMAGWMNSFSWRMCAVQNCSSSSSCISAWPR